MSWTEEQYLSYLLRLWRVRVESGWSWRASLEDPINGEIRAFHDKEKLYAYLETKTVEPDPKPAPDSDESADRPDSE